MTENLKKLRNEAQVKINLKGEKKKSERKVFDWASELDSCLLADPTYGSHNFILVG